MSNDIRSSLSYYYLCYSFVTEVKYLMFVVLNLFDCLSVCNSYLHVSVLLSANCSN